MGKSDTATPSSLRRFLSCDFFICRFMHSGCLKQDKHLVKKLPFTQPLGSALALLSDSALPAYSSTTSRVQGLLKDDSPERNEDDAEKKKAELANKVKEKLKESQKNREVLFREKMLHLQQRFEDELVDLNKNFYPSRKNSKSRKESFQNKDISRPKHEENDGHGPLSPLVITNFNGDTSGETTENAMTSFSVEDEEMLLKRLEFADIRKNERARLTKHHTLQSKSSDSDRVILRSVSEGNEFLSSLFKKSKRNEDYEQMDMDRLLFYSGKKSDKTPIEEKKDFESFAFHLDFPGKIVKSFSQPASRSGQNPESDELEDVDLRYQAFKNLGNGPNSVNDKGFGKQEKGGEGGKGPNKLVTMGEQWEALDRSITLDQKYLSLDAMALNAEERALEWARKRGQGSGTYTEVSIGKTQSAGSFSAMESPEGFNQLWKNKSEKEPSNQGGGQVTQLFEKLVDSEEVKLLPFARHEASLRVEKKIESEERKEWEKLFRAMQERVKASISEEEKNMLQQERVEMLDRVDEILAKEEVDLLEAKKKEMTERVVGDIARDEERLRETKRREMLKRVEEEMRDLEEMERHSRVERIRLRAKELEKTVLTSERTKVIERVKKLLEIEKREYLERRRNEMKAAIESEEMHYLEKMRKEMFGRIKRILQEEGMKLLDLERSKNGDRRSNFLLKDNDQIYAKFLNSDISERKKDIFRLHRWVSQKLEKVIHMKDYEEEREDAIAEKVDGSSRDLVAEILGESASSASKSLGSERKDSPHWGGGEPSGREGGRPKDKPRDDKTSDRYSDRLSMDSGILTSPNRAKIEKEWLKESSKRDREDDGGGMHRFPSMDTSVGAQSESLNFSEENSLLGGQPSLPKSEDTFLALDSSQKLERENKRDEKDKGDVRRKGVEDRIKRKDSRDTSKPDDKGKRETSIPNLLEELKSEMEREKPQIWMEVEAALKSNLAVGEKVKSELDNEEKQGQRESRKSPMKSREIENKEGGNQAHRVYPILYEESKESSLEKKESLGFPEVSSTPSFVNEHKARSVTSEKKNPNDFGLLFPLSEPEFATGSRSLGLNLDLDWEREKERLKKELELEIKRETESKGTISDKKSPIDRRGRKEKDKDREKGKGKEKEREKKGADVDSRELGTRREAATSKNENEFSFGMLLDEAEFRRRLKEEMASENGDSTSLAEKEAKALKELAILEMATNEKVEEEKRKLKDEAMKRLQYAREEVEEKVSMGIERLKEEARRRLQQQIEEVERDMRREREDARNERLMSVLSELEGEERSMVGEWREAMKREESLLRAAYKNRMKQLRSQVERLSMSMPVGGKDSLLHGIPHGYHPSTAAGGDAEEVDDGNGVAGRGRNSYGHDPLDGRIPSPWDAFDEFGVEADSVANSLGHRDHRSSASRWDRRRGSFANLTRSAPSAYNVFDSPSGSLDDRDGLRWDESERSSVKQRRSVQGGIRLTTRRSSSIFGPRSPVHISLAKSSRAAPLYHSHSSASASHFPNSGSIQASPSNRSDTSWRMNPFSRLSNRRGPGFEPIMEVASRHDSPKFSASGAWGPTREAHAGDAPQMGKERSSSSGKRERRKSLGGEGDGGLARRLDDVWRMDLREEPDAASVPGSLRGTKSPEIIEPVPNLEPNARSKSPSNRAIEMRGGITTGDIPGTPDDTNPGARGNEIVQDGESGGNWKRMVAGLSSSSRRRRRKWRKKAPSSLIFGEDPNDVYFSSSADSKNDLALRKSFGRFGKTPSV